MTETTHGSGSAAEGLRAAVVGYGGSGAGIHSRLLRATGNRVTHVVARHPGRVAQARADEPGVQVFADLPALLAADPDVDLVVLASPSGLHAEHAHAVIDAGLPLVVDKPLATGTDEAREVVEHAERAGVPLTVFQNRRWDDEQRTLRAVVSRGELGRVHRFERRWERWRPVPLDRWKENDPVGGGLLLDLGAHLVDSAVELFGPVTSVFAELRALLTPAVDDVFLALTHDSGTVSHLSAGSLVGAPGPRTRVLGAAGAFLVLSYESERSAFDVLDAGARGHGGWLVRGDEREAVPLPSGGHEDFYRAVREWLRAAAPVPVDPWDAVRTARVLDAARESAASGQVVRLG